jgi:hypothetical protein
MGPQYANLCATGSNDRPHALGFRVERSMAQDAPNEVGDLALIHAETNDAVTAMAEVLIEKTKITREKRGAIEPPQQWEDVLLIFHAFSTDVDADLSHADVPASEEAALIFPDVLVKEIHYPVCRGERPARSTKAAFATRIASAIAAGLIAPRHCSRISSQDMPSATCSNTSLTRMRVPRNVG